MNRCPPGLVLKKQELKYHTCRVINCEERPIYNYSGENSNKYCQLHATPDMIDAKKEREQILAHYFSLSKRLATKIANKKQFKT